MVAGAEYAIWRTTSPMRHVEVLKPAGDPIIAAAACWSPSSAPSCSLLWLTPRSFCCSKRMFCSQRRRPTVSFGGGSMPSAL